MSINMNSANPMGKLPTFGLPAARTMGTRSNSSRSSSSSSPLRSTASRGTRSPNSLFSANTARTFARVRKQNVRYNMRQAARMTARRAGFRGL